jgi:hypothetical protein
MVEETGVDSGSVIDGGLEVINTKNRKTSITTVEVPW